jgi:hypothetical protein
LCSLCILFCVLCEPLPIQREVHQEHEERTKNTKKINDSTLRIISIGVLKFKKNPVGINN